MASAAETMDGPPTQAVILAGGRGTRLRPLTLDCPKPMIEFHGKPFLAYLMEMARGQGIRRVLLLLGYLPDVIRDYFGNGSRFGLLIDYAVSDVDDDTGRRLWLARERLDPTFLLLYCDNYWPMPLADMWRHFRDRDAAAQIAVYRNGDGYTRDNLIVGADGLVEVYDKTRTAPGLAGVDIGFAIVTAGVLDAVGDANVSFEAVVYPELIARGRLAAYRTSHRYYSVGSHERLGLTRDFLARRPAILLDRDGVLNRRMPRGEYVRSWDDWDWLPGAREALRLLKQAGVRVAIVSNQAGIARGCLSAADLDALHGRMTREARDSGGAIDRVYVCPHHWDDGCDCRKPAPGMLFQAQRDLGLDLSLSCFVGDDERDREAAERAGCPFEMVGGGTSLLDVVETRLGNGGP